MNSPPFNAHTMPLFKNCNILKFADIKNVGSCICINNCFNRDSYLIVNENFKLFSTTHSHNTTSARNGLLFVPSYSTVNLGENQLFIQPLLHGIQDKLTENNFLCLTPKSKKSQNILSKIFHF